MEELATRVVELMRVEDCRPHLSLVVKRTRAPSDDRCFDVANVTVQTVNGRRVFKIGLKPNCRSKPDTWTWLIAAETEQRVVADFLAKFLSARLSVPLFKVCHTSSDGKRHELFELEDMKQALEMLVVMRRDPSARTEG